MKIQFKWVEHNTDDYHKSVELRDKVLRKPLNMVFTQVQLDAEADQFHLVGITNGHVIACLVLKPEDKTRIQMRQVAVDPAYQNQGIGSMLVHHSEMKSKALNLKQLFLHARDVAVPFYTNLNYQIEGDAFIEVGITHYNMIKNL